MGSRRGLSIAGIPVKVQVLFFVLVGVVGIYYPLPGAWLVIATVSVLLHEFGHALAFRAFGLSPRITLHGMGGLTTAELTEPGAPPFTPVRSIVTSLAGPLAALVLLGLPAYFVAVALGLDPWLLHHRPAYGWSSVDVDALEVVLAQVVYVNVIWSLFNLMPVLPLDGGNVTASVFELVAPRHGRRVANVVSIVLMVVFALWALQYGMLFAPVFAALFIGLNVSELLGNRHERVDRDLDAARGALIDFDPVRADQLARAALDRGLPAERRRDALELRAWSLLAQGDTTGAAQLAVAMPGGAGPSASLRGALALTMGRPTEGVATLAWAFANGSDRDAKVLGAIAVAQADQVEPVVRELLLLGPVGREGALLLQALLEHTGHRGDAHTVDVLLTASAPRPPGW